MTRGGAWLAEAEVTANAEFEVQVSGRFRSSDRPRQWTVIQSGVANIGVRAA
jgi:hypothetical protein